MIKYFFSGLFLYLIVGFGLFLLQRRLIFNKSGIPNKPSYYGLKNISEEQISISDSIQLLTWFAPPKNNNPTLVYFHGNAFDLGERAYRIKNYIDKGMGVLLPAYRGYSGNMGKPTEKNLYDDSEIIIDWLKKKLLINENKIIIYGESLGTAVAIHISQFKKFKAVILEASFTSIASIAQKMYPIYPVKYLIWDKIYTNKINLHVQSKKQIGKRAGLLKQYYDQ